MKIPGSWCQYYRDEPVLTNSGDVIDFNADDSELSLKFLEKT